MKILKNSTYTAMLDKIESVQRLAAEEGRKVQNLLKALNESESCNNNQTMLISVQEQNITDLRKINDELRNLALSSEKKLATARIQNDELVSKVIFLEGKYKALENAVKAEIEKEVANSEKNLAPATPITQTPPKKLRKK